MLTPAQAVQVVRTLWTQQIKKFPPPDQEWSERWCATFTQSNMIEGIRITANKVKAKRLKTAEDAYRYAFGCMKNVLPVPDSKEIADAKNAAAMAAMQRQVEEYKQRNASNTETPVVQNGAITI